MSNPQKKIVTIVGARPQFVKAAVMSKEIQLSTIFTEVVVHTGQHFDANMSDVFFEDLNIPKPDYTLNIHSLSHAAMTGRMMEEIEKILFKESPDLVLVYGDTNSTLAAALAASKMHVPLAHVEAGLRSYNMLMPEEQNRRVTDLLSTWLFCPSADAVLNLEKEGITTSHHKIHNVGDVMCDAVQFFKPHAEFSSDLPENFALLTLHRAENTDDIERLSEIVNAINVLADNQFPIVFPVHPRTKMAMKNMVLSSNIFCIEPVGYLEMLGLLNQSGMVMTDSGGLQKEAYFSGKFCVTLRTETEWVELVELGVNVLATESEEIVFQASKNFGAEIDNSENVYGNGSACRNIIQILESSFTN